MLQRKRIVEAEFAREDIKQNNMDYSNFGNLICLQFIDAEKKQSSFDISTFKKSSTWVAKFSPNIKLLATGGSDGILRIFKVNIVDEKIYPEGELDFQILDPNFQSFIGHKFDIVDISWFKVFFVSYFYLK